MTTRPFSGRAGGTATISATNTSATATFTDRGDREALSVLITNIGTVATHIRLSYGAAAVAATTSDVVVAPNASWVFAKSNPQDGNFFVTARTASGTATVYATCGTGGV